MTRPGSLAMVMLLCALSSGALQHQPGLPPPPAPLDPERANTQQEQQPTLPPQRVDLAQVQREADELARTAETIPSDVASVRKGMLPKDIIEKLKHIEKMSKHLRSELTP